MVLRCEIIKAERNLIKLGTKNAHLMGNAVKQTFGELHNKFRDKFNVTHSKIT
jgi:hypothetical protein